MEMVLIAHLIHNGRQGQDFHRKLLSMYVDNQLAKSKSKTLYSFQVTNKLRATFAVGRTQTVTRVIGPKKVISFLHCKNNP